MKHNNYLIYFLPLLICCFSFLQYSDAQGVTTQKSGANMTAKWSSNPFDHQVFIENKGQFDGKAEGMNKILFAAQIGDVYAFITKHGIVYKYEEHPELHPEKGKDGITKKMDPDEMGEIKHTPHYLSATWENSNDGSEMVTSEPLTYYYTYPTGNKTTIKAAVFRKVTCRNVYPGIDVEYLFPKDKGGIKYTLVVHPGADVSLAKLKYSGAKKMKLDLDGNVRINTGWGKFEDHAPVSFYEEEGYSPVASGYTLKDDEESFYANDIDPTKTLLIDPWSINWTQNPNFVSSSGFDGAYDVDFDYAGNVYVYGGWNPFQLVKYNAAGVQQWVYNTSNFPNLYYGDFCVDKASGTSFALEGFGGGGNAWTDKISASGALLASFTTATSSLDEQWRATYDLCDHIIVIAGGGTTQTFQAATLDTNLTTYTLANVLNLPPNTAYHDMCLIATDPLLPVGYMATTWTYANTSLDNNVLLQLPLPLLVPAVYNVSDGYNFQECNSPAYIGPGNYNGSKATNGMNGMACSPNWLYMYDGLNLNQVVKATGALNATTNLGGTSYDWGGLDVDLCDDIYVGHQTDVDLYNSSLTQTGTIGPFPGNVYDVVLGNGVLSTLDSTLYVCGNGFVSSVHIAPPQPPKIVKVKNQVCSCNGTAKATLMICNTPDTVGVSYLWSNGQTTQTATGLCPANTYTVTITAGCAEIFSDTVIFSNSGSLTVTKASTNATCVTPGTASITVAGGATPYTYLWSNGATTSNVGGLGAGNICVSVTDNLGCQDTVCFIINGVGLPPIAINPNPDSICSGSGITLTASGGVSYTWLPVAGLSCNTCASPTASPASTTIYTVTGTDANGCTNKDSVVVKVFPPPVITVTPANDTICIGNSVNLSAAGALSYTWAPSTGLSCNNCFNPTANPTVTTSYLVTGTDAYGCTGTTNVTVNVDALATISLSASATSVCTGGSVTLNATSTGISTPYVWQPGAMTGPTIVVSPTATTTYTVTGSNACNTVSQTITINVNPLPLPSFTADVMQGCSPLCIQFRDLSSVTSGGISTWTWFFGNGDSLKSENPIYCYPNPGTYSVILAVTSDSGCSSTLKKLNMITVYSHPMASFSLSPQPTTIIEPTIQFTDKSTDSYGISFWMWNFGDSDTLVTKENPSHTYGDTGTYCTRLVVMNIHGCTDTLINCLIIDPIFTIYIPDAFSPNGDGKNDVFTVKGNDIKTFEMYIFDRWGMQLFHTTDITNGWNGTVSGGNTISQEDTYVYLIKVTDHKDKRHSYTGKLNLIK